MAAAIQFPFDVVHSDPEVLGGTPVFAGTRVPAQSLFEYLEAGDSLDDFLQERISADWLRMALHRWSNHFG